MPELRIIGRSQDGRFIPAGDRDGCVPVFGIRPTGNERPLRSVDDRAGPAQWRALGHARETVSRHRRQSIAGLIGTRSSCRYVTGFPIIDPAPCGEPSAEAYTRDPTDMLNNLHESPLKLTIDFQFDPQRCSLKIVRSSTGER